MEQLEKVVKYAGLDLNKYTLRLIFLLHDAINSKKEDLTVGEIDKIKEEVLKDLQEDQIKAQAQAQA